MYREISSLCYWPSLLVDYPREALNKACMLLVLVASEIWFCRWHAGWDGLDGKLGWLGSPALYTGRRRTRLSSGRYLGEQGLLYDDQIGRREQGMQLRDVLGQAAVAPLRTCDSARSRLCNPANL